MGAMDIVFAVVIGLSVAFGVWRGLTRELVSMIAWVLIAVLAVRYAAPLGRLMPFEAPPLVLTAVGAGAIIVLGVLAAAAVGRLLKAAIVASRLAGADRVLGGVFGALRGALLALLITWIFVEAGFSDTRVWRNSASALYLEHVYHWMAGTVPNRRVPLVMSAGD